MGQTSFPLSSVNNQGRHLREIEEGQGYKVLQDRKSQEEYLLLTRVVMQKESLIEKQLQRRAKVKGKHIPELVEFGKEYPHYCSEAGVLHILFKKPAKTLREEMQNRRAIHEWFNEGEIMMIVYCSLSALLELKQAKMSSGLHVDEESLFISNKGGVVLSDTSRFGESSSNRNYSWARQGVKNQNKDSEEMINIKQLAAMVERMDLDCNFSQGFRQFLIKMRNGDIQSCQEGLKGLFDIKMHQRQTQKPLNFSHQKQNSQNIINTLQPALPCNKKNKREPLKQIRLVCKQNQLHSQCQSSQEKVNEVNLPFEAGNNDSFSEGSLHFDEVGARLDDFSSIAEIETSKQSEQESANKSASLIQVESQVSAPSIDFIFPRRTERLRQLVLNQKEIIYEESDQLSSLPSHRTRRVQSICGP